MSLDLALRERACEACGAWFTALRSDARTCSTRCRKALSRRRWAIPEAPSRDESAAIRDEIAVIRDNEAPKRDRNLATWSDKDPAEQSDFGLWKEIRSWR